MTLPYKISTSAKISINHYGYRTAFCYSSEVLRIIFDKISYMRHSQHQCFKQSVSLPIHVLHLWNSHRPKIPLHLRHHKFPEPHSQTLSPQNPIISNFSTPLGSLWQLLLGIFVLGSSRAIDALALDSLRAQRLVFKHLCTPKKFMSAVSSASIATWRRLVFGKSQGEETIRRGTNQ